MTQDMNHTFRKALRAVFVAAMMSLMGSHALAQGSGTGVYVMGNVYGGGNLAPVGGNVVVNMKAGTVEKDVYGGGALANTNTNNWNAEGEGYELVSGLTVGTSVVTGLYTKSGESYTEITAANKTAEANTDYYKKVGTWAEGMYNSSTGATANITTVNLTGGTIKGDAYGGGLGQLGNDPVAATVYGNISVTLGGSGEGSSATAFNISYFDGDHSDVVKSGRVFGCNNLNGSPKGNVTVTVNKTVRRNAQGELQSKPQRNTQTYEVAAVYGGGNLANFVTNGKKTHVIINGCDETSINYVYGGGNAAAVPETDVDINAAYEIEYVFGGGNGKDEYKLDGSTWKTNPGANVNGNANTMLYGGTIHEAFGGSNEKGTISGSVYINTDTNDDCDLDVDKLYGAGKNADIEGDLKIILGCKTKRTEEVYGGAENANVKGNVELTITSGEFGKVFGGNNQSGAIFGHIILNIEETGCRPIEIDELYLGGNQAAYSVYGYYKGEYYLKNDGNYYLDVAYTIPLYQNDGKLYLDAEKTKRLYPKTEEGHNYLYLDEEYQKPLYRPRTSASDGTAVTFTGLPNTNPNATSAGQYDNPELNIISCTRIGKVFGGGLGEGAVIYGSPTVNINQIFGIQADANNPGSYIPATELGEIGGSYVKDGETVEGGVFGGGNQAKVVGNTTVNIGTKTTVDLHRSVDANGEYTMLQNQTVKGAKILSNVYGGGNLADVTGNTFVNICAVESGTTYSPVAEGDKKVNIAGNVFGGGKGAYDSFTCEKAMVGTPDAGFDDATNKVNTSYADGNTRVTIGNGTVTGNVYGGGEVGRVEMNTTVMIGTETGTSAPVIDGSVYGAGQGVDTHGYSGLARGNATVTIQGSAWVKESVYGGGEKASVGRYWVKGGADPNSHAPAVPDGLPEGMPYALKDPNSGKCYVTVKGKAKIGPETLTMPTFKGNVFGGCKGILPGAYSYADNTNKPKRWVGNDWSYFADEPAYIQFIRTLALNNETHVTIGDADDSSSNPFVKGSVYGGSENGGVMANTYVTIESGQIGCGNNTLTQPYDASVWAANYTPTDATDLECPHWIYGIDTDNDTDHKKDLFAPYDKFAKEDGTYDYTGIDLPSTEQQISSSEGGRPASKASDGHTFYGNVFGGGSGKDPYKPGKWLMTAGGVGGNTNVTINGGHILTSVYGGNELTNVGEELVNDETKNKGKCIVRMSGGTIGVPRTIQQIIEHPVTCNLFGAGKGDQRVLFNKWTNVNDVDILISGGTIYGSVFGGGEDGHVMRDVMLEIGQASNNTTKIGTWGTSGFEGNVFGAGRGFGGDAYTAGNIGGSVDLDITGGSILGSVYGGGRLASVGYGLYDKGVNGYGELRDDNKDDAGNSVTYFTTTSSMNKLGRGHIDINISGGTIGNNHEFKRFPTDAEKSATGNLRFTSYDDENKLLHTKGGNVYAGGMGRRTLLNGEPTPPIVVEWRKLGNAKSTKLTISGDAWIKGNVYGGGELGAVQGTHPSADDTNTAINVGTEIIINGGIIGTVMGTNAIDDKKVGSDDDTRYAFGSVYGGGYGTEEERTSTDFDSNPSEKFAAYVSSNARIKMTDGKVRGSIYGGGEVACIGSNTYVTVTGGEVGINQVRKDSYQDYGAGYVLFGSWRMGNVYGGGRGSENDVIAGLVKGNTYVNINETDHSNKPLGIYHNIYGGGAIGSVGTFSLTTEEVRDPNDNTIILIPKGAPTGWSENTGTATVTITGTPVIGINGHDNGIISGSSRGDVTKPSTTDNVDIYDRLGWVKETVVTIGKTDGSDSPDIRGSVYGGGENGHNSGDATVHVYSGEIGNPAKPATLYSTTPDTWENRGSVYGAGCGTDTYTGSDNNKHHNRTAGFVQGSSNVYIHGGHVYKSVYGGGSMGSVGADGKKATVNISGGTVEESVYGGPKGDPNDTETIAHAKATEVTMAGGTVKGSVFGGGESGIVEGSVTVSMTGGTVSEDVYGGGALADTQTSNWDATKNEGAGGWADGKTSASNTTTVRLTGGIVGGKAYGGGLGEANNPAYVYGDVLVDLNGTTTMDNTTGKPTTTGTMTENTAGCVVEQVFGANNVNGTPKGDVMVHVYATRNKEKTTIAKKFRYEDESLDKLDITETTKETDEDYVARLKAVLADKIEIAEALGLTVSNDDKTLSTSSSATADALKTAITGLATNINTKTTDEINAVRYDVKAVYGGGNQATYNPLSPNTSTTSTPNGPQTQVIIEGCDYTSIETVYGGGNAAAVPETNVEIKAAYEILNVFGGGNGKDAPAPGVENPGADVGTRDNGTSKYGTGNANSLLEGGHIHEVYGGSNQKGIIKGSINQTSNPDASVCELVISKVVGAGKYADIDGDVNMILGCQPSKKVDLLFAGADEANVNGNISLTITNGNFGKVFGGNNLGGAVKGKITVNVEETGCQPIRIDELYLGGNEAAYSVYGYYESEDVHKVTGKKILKPRTAEMHAITDQMAEGYMAPVTNPATDATHTFPYAQPVLNIISCTYIGKVFGGGYGEGAKMYANPTVNVNQIKGTPNGVTSSSLGTIGEVYGGGNAAKVIGNTTVNIGTAETVTMITVPDDPNTTDVSENQPTVLGANITGNVYGGGNLADVTGNTFVNICAKYDSETKKYVAVDEGTEGVTIGGTVYGGGRGQEDTFLCEKAMIGEDGLGADNPDYPNGNTSVRIGHGTVNGSVYGGGQVGRVEMNTVVEIGFGDGGSGSKSPVIEGYVFGAGAGVKTHGYSALVRGNTNVTIAGNTWVKKSVYGGGEIASVARYRVAQSDEEGAPYGVEKGEPYLLENPNSGYCYVTVQGHAEIGTNGMKMYHIENGTISADDKPDDWGHVFAAGKGVLPDTYNFDNFSAADRKNYPKRMALYDSEKYKSTEEKVTWEYVDPTHKETNKNIWEYFNTEAKYFTFIQTLGLATQTEATIDGNALVYGSVYGGSENGLVQFDTNVKIDGDCQIGVAEGEGKPDCAHWEFKAPYEPYDPYAKYLNDGEGGDGLYYYDEDHSKSAAGGAKIATDGHTYYGNVFGGGSGSVPYFNTLEGKSEYLSNAGTVKGNTYVTIDGGHILTNVYGGCEATNVLGTANVTMTNGTVGVERTDEQIIALPLTGYIFGGGKGDQRIFFNKETNVNHSIVKIEGGRIYGSVYGGGEDGHVLGNVTMTIGKTGNTGPTIGTQGTSYYDGNVFGGGRGFGGEALTAGNVGGAVTLDILGGQILGSVYGGGRLASVGYGLYLVDEEVGGVKPYGKMREDNEYDGSYPDPSSEAASAFYTKGRGKISVTVSGGTIGNDVENAEYGGNVFGGSMGRLTKLDGSAFDSADHWSLLATAKKTTVNVTGGTIKRSVYGGGEMGTVTTNATVNVSGGTIGTSGKGGAEFGNVYGGGKGYVDPAGSDYITAGIIKGNTAVTISNTLADEAYADAHEGVSEGDPIGGPTIYHSVYGGGAYGSLGTFTYYGESSEYSTNYNKYKPGGSEANATKLAELVARKYEITGYTSGGKADVIITGGTIGTNGKENGMVFGSSRGDVGATGEIHDKLAWVHDTHVIIGTTGQGTDASTPLIKGSVYGSGENGHTYQNTIVDVHSGTIGIASGGDITDNNGTPNDEEDDITYSGAEYPYRGNVYGGGCGTDKYYDDPTGIANPYDGNGDTFNPLAGIVYGTSTVNIDGGLVVHNVYGAGAMGSVGRTVTTTANNVTTTTTTGGLTTINISGGTIGVSGTVGDGNVFGAARGDKDAKGNDLAPVRLANVRETSVNISSGAIKGNVYGGGEVGSVGTYTVSDDMKNYKFENNTGTCSVTIDGGMIGTGVSMSDDGTFANGNVYGAGKGLANTFWCEKGMVYSTTVTINDGTVYGTVYGGGEVGRVENNATVTIGVSNPEGTTPAPTIAGNVFGAGAGLETHGYSALLRGDTEVTVQGNAQVGLSVYGGGEKASVGRFVVDGGIPKEPESDGSGDCTVKVQGNAVIAGSVYGTGQGVTPHYYTNVEEYADTAQMPKRMMAITMGTFNESNKDYWQYVSDDDPNNVWEYLNSKQKYLDFLPTMALASHPEVTIDGNATVSGSVYGGGQRGITLGTVAVNIKGGTVTEDVYGGGALANTNKGNWDANTDTWASGKSSATYTTTVNLHGGIIGHNVYGGGLGQKHKDAVAAEAAQGTEGQEGYVPAVEAQDEVPAIAALVYGDVMVKLNETPTVTEGVADFPDNCVVKGVIHGANNYFGSPKGDVTVHVYKTATIGNGWTEPKKDSHGAIVYESDGTTPVYVTHKKTALADLHSENEALHFYDLKAVYGGGNEATYDPKESTSMAHVIIDGCDDTSIETVYGGGNAAATPATLVEVNSCYEIGTVFGGGNGKDDMDDGSENPGADVGYKPNDEGGKNSYGSGIALAELHGGTIHQAFGGSNTKGNVRTSGTVTLDETDPEGCPLCIEEVYGAGNEADQDGTSNINLGCLSYLSEIYGGAKNADINNDIVLNIQSGRFNRVFGGNNLGGTIRGTITVNIEETGCHPIVIGQLFGGGNQAAYTAPSGKPGPTVNVKSFTSIGEIYGGGFGSSAEVTGDTYININEYKGKYADERATVDFTDESGNPVIENGVRVKVSENTGKWIHFLADASNANNIATVWQPEHREGAIGTIGNVFGGGNEAGVTGSTNVRIGNMSYVPIASVVAGTTDVRGYYTRSGEGTTEIPYVYTLVSDLPVPPVSGVTYYVKEDENYSAATITVEVTDVRDYYTRSGEGTTESPYVYTQVSDLPVLAGGSTTYYKAVLGANITGNVYGGGNAANVSGDTNVVIGREVTTP